MSNQFQTHLVKQHTHLPARVCRLETPHGEVMTPTFMPVGTRAYVNQMTVSDLEHSGSHLILGGNTYHMLCNPGLDFIERVGGMHALMGWKRSMLTDSGGFQVFSLSKNGNICKIDEKGAHFKHPINGQLIHLTPETSIHAQKVIGADIIMAFDECTPEQGGRAAAEAAMQRTHRWLLESKAAQDRNPNSQYGLRQALFGIIQGGSFHDLREQSAAFILSCELDGIAIGGEVIGFDMAKTMEIVNFLRPMLPDNKIRYTMGVGLNPQDLIDVVAAGIDIFDCVAPTRNARHGSLYCGKMIVENNWLRFESEYDRQRMLIKKAIFASDENPIMADCPCYTCQHHTRAYLHFLFKSDAPLYHHLASIHNVQVMQSVCEKMRDLILASSE